jgi:hypothetical protein
VRVPFCVGGEGCASWGGVQVAFASWSGQVGVFKLRCSSWGVQVGVCSSGVENTWFPSKPPLPVKVNRLGRPKSTVFL